MKHTPGPWQTGEPYLKHFGYPHGKPWFVRQIGPKQPTDDIQIALVHANENFERDEELEANARLIAAAPDLLATIKTVMRKLPSKSPEHLLAEKAIAAAE